MSTEILNIKTPTFAMKSSYHSDREGASLAAVYLGREFQKERDGGGEEIRIREGRHP